MNEGIVVSERIQMEMDKYDTLKKIVEQLESCNYESEGGYLRNNIAFMKLKDLSERTEDKNQQGLAIIQTNPILALFEQKEITKESITEIVVKIMESDFTFKDLALVKAIVELGNQLLEGVKNNLNPNEIDNSGYSYKGILIEKAKSPTTYNYDEDAVYFELNEKLKARKKELSDNYKWSMQNQNIGNPNFKPKKDSAGNDVPVISIKKASEDIFKITIKK